MKAKTINHQTIEEIISGNKIAIAGVSRDPKKFGHIVFKMLKEKGFSLFPINPNAETIEGEQCYSSVNELPENVKTLLIVVKPDKAPELIDQSIKKGIEYIWFQQGSSNKDAIEKATSAGLKIISNKCILMYASPSGIHKFHSTISKFLGKY